MTLDTIMVDDSPIALRSLEQLCARTPQINPVASFVSPMAALEFLDSTTVQLIFLDMEMPEMSGIEFIGQLSALPQIVITSGYREYACDAYEYDVTDYLQKPYSADRFGKAIQRVSDRERQWHDIASSSIAQEIYLRHDGKITRMPLDQIKYFENAGDYIKVYTTGKVYIIHGTIKALEQKINNPRFLKVHRSYIINLDWLQDIEDNTLLIEKQVIPISRAQRPKLMQCLHIV